MIHTIKNAFMTAITNYGKTKVFAGLVIIVSIVTMIVRINISNHTNNTTSKDVEATPSARSVSLYTISSTNGSTVRATDGNTFIVRAESSGRVEKIVKVGDVLTRGAVVAHIEDSVQRAAVLQAQGAYEAAIAGAAQSNVSADDAKNTLVTAENNAITAYRNAYTSASSIVINDIDVFFSDPDNNHTPGVKVDLYFKDVLYLNNERVKLQTTLQEWKESSVALSTSDNIDQKLTEAETNVRTIISIIDILIEATRTAGLGETIDGKLVTSYTDGLTSTRATLNGILTTLSSAETTLTSARENLKRTEIGSTQSTDISLANAQVRQALGILESARATLEKTSVKTPISGTVTAVSISVGDIINVGSNVVFIASDSTSDTEDTVTVPLTAVKFTPTKAFVFTVVDNHLVAHEVHTGTVTSKSIAISGVENLTDIVLDVRGLKDGDTVTIK